MEDVAKAHQIKRDVAKDELYKALEALHYTDEVGCLIDGRERIDRFSGNVTRVFEAKDRSGLVLWSQQEGYGIGVASKIERVYVRLLQMDGKLPLTENETLPIARRFRDRGIGTDEGFAL